MEQRQGIFHQTTIQAAKAQRNTYQTTSVAGNKRSSSEALPQRPAPTQTAPRTEFRRALSLGRNVPKLVASAITLTDHGKEQAPEVSEYSQRQAISATPTSTVDRSLLLSFPRYALPATLVSNFNGLGIKEIYPWQKHCLMGPGLLDGTKNLVYTAPTGGGKSLVADVLMLKRVLEDQNAKALLILPYVALVQEKVRWLRKVVQDISRRPPGKDKEIREPGLWRRRADEDTIRVVGFFGGGKANTLINTAIDDCSISKLRAVVLDELHMIDDDHRGYLLELTATKLLSLEHNVQIIGMSATLPNVEVLATWLNAHRYQTMYRPVPIDEHLVFESNIYAASSTSSMLKAATQLKTQDSKPTQPTSSPIRTIQASQHKELKDVVLNSVVALTDETVRAGFGVLIFCSSRVGCESDARIVSLVLPAPEELDDVTAEKRADLLADLRSLPSGLDPVLAETVPAGVAFHHASFLETHAAGLTTEERDLIADAYDCGTLKVIVATCSLAAGINLPARRVILHNARMGRDLIGPSMLRQMRGRAGRKGKDEVGETYLCCRKNDLEDVVELMHADLPRISSGLMTDKHRIQRALLEVIAVRLATSPDSLDDYMQKTLLSFTATPADIKQHVQSSLTDLTNMGFMTPDDSGGFEATQLGKAVVASALEPEDGAFVHRELQRALRAFVMDGEMHILYTFTPVQDFGVTVNWQVFRNEMETLDDSGLRVLSFLSLRPTFINRMAQGGKMKEETPEDRELSRIYCRFYLALQLRDICNESPIHAVARKYDVPRGSVQTLAQTCQGFAAGMVKFCEGMRWGLKAGAKADLLELAKITFVKSRTARVFYDNGFKSVASIANADPMELVPVLMQAQPTKVRLQSKDEVKYGEKLLAKAKVIADSANRLWQLQMQQEINEE
ncbi:hypothetical protein LQW54_007921 [Pestalotiopsis sp. IQ-011]